MPVSKIISARLKNSEHSTFVKRSLRNFGVQCFYFENSIARFQAGGGLFDDPDKPELKLTAK
jgi:hypothetical protein